jgi:TolB-like protein/DNA-binding winged helix-turn-helix (wHTH) protein/cytochrome c-type biogenesis protein CcmH/NrfG
MSTPDPHTTFRIRDVVLDLVAYEVRRDGRAVRLERQPMDLLILLVRRRGQLVTRAEIVDALWGKDVFVDVETGVHTAIRKIRQALRDAPEAPTFIETVPGKGYRFIAPVEVVLPEAVTPTSPAAARWLRRLAIVAASVLGAALALIVGWSLRGTPPPEATSLTIAVLPFDSLGRAADEYLADGLTEDTIVSLGRIDPDHISVIGRTTMFAYKDTRKSLAEIGRELDADYIVEGSLRVEAGRMRITSRLVRPGDQVQVWSDSFDRDGGGTLGVQQELSRNIAAQVSTRLSPDRSRALDRRHSLNEDAFDHFLRGRASFNRRTPDAMRQAVDSFRRAIEADPDYALAWASLAAAYAGRAVNSDAEPREMLTLAREAANRAVRIDADLPEAQRADGNVRWLLEWDWAAAEAAVRRALALDPSYAEAHQLLGHLLSQTGRHEEAAARMRRASELEPLDAVQRALSSQVAFQARDNSSARQHARRAIDLNPALWFGHQMLGQVQAEDGEGALALQSSARAIELSARNSKPVSLHGYVLARSGRTAEARALLASLEALSQERYVPPYAMALVHAGLGDEAAVFDWLERAYAVRDVHLIYLPVDPKWDPYRSDPRFVAILARCGFVAP